MMKKKSIDIDSLSKDLMEDLKELKNEGIEAQVICMHLYKAYILGRDDSKEYWWEQIDADSEYSLQFKKPKYMGFSFLENEEESDDGV